ncbi:hypothetical protein [Aquibacillus albus]|uniref:TM2 domain-containing membrane protein YozV n=1 Tax=Aquibacillus albus TaxID=1168171 RepID=A0ABS2N5J7_9BACI|nr:hypothetical protein [Aquibacillus albus]MBM7573411.1 TM2 domain-containing membrane protein YozV [Aquibacillus albus]
MNKQNPYFQNKRHILQKTTAITSNQLHFRSPWMVAWWSLAFPGFGHFIVNSYLWGFILMSFEYMFNTMSKINLSIFFSMLGDFEQAKQVINVQWFFLYIVVYVFSVWDSYRRTIDNNKVYQLAYKEVENIAPTQFSVFEINVLEKKKPWIAMVWSFLLPSLGYIYLQRICTFLFNIVWWIVILYFSRFPEGLYLTMIGNFEEVKKLLDPQWILYIPSIYAFTLYNTYAFSVENNKLFDMSQSRYLKNEYQSNQLCHFYQK